MRARHLNILLAVVPAFCLACTSHGTKGDNQGHQLPWDVHVIDNTLQGADGVKLADANGDGLPDLATGWEEGGVSRVYLHPGYGRAHDPWPAVTVGAAPRVEDAAFADLDGDGVTDVISACEADARVILIHWGPSTPSQYVEPTAWKTEALPASVGVTQRMFCVAVQATARMGRTWWPEARDRAAARLRGSDGLRPLADPASWPHGGGIPSPARAGSCPSLLRTWMETAIWTS